MSKTTTRGGWLSLQSKTAFQPPARWLGGKTTSNSHKLKDQAGGSQTIKIISSHCSPLTRSILDGICSCWRWERFPPCLSWHISTVSERSSTMTKIQLDYYLQSAAAVPPSLGQLQCFFLLNLDRISVGFLLKTVPGYSWASACAKLRRTSSYQEYLFFIPWGEIKYFDT